MIDFTKLSRKKEAGLPESMVALFDQLDRRATHASLRPLQIEALGLLHARQNEPHTVLKASTGSGKTVIGLVYADFMRRKYPGEPVLYLCPTNQLVDQVSSSAQAIGVPFEAYGRDGPPQSALRGEAIMGCTYSAVYNALSRLVRANVVPAAIVLDDVHAGIENVRASFTVNLPADAYDSVRTILGNLCESSDAPIWRGIRNSESYARYDVPFWALRGALRDISRRLEAERNSDELKFQFGNVERYLEFVRVCISGVQVEASLHVPPVEENSVYGGARHKLYMSASIKDGSSLVRELGCDIEALHGMVELKSDRGAGERMILPVSLIGSNITKEQVAALCREMSRNVNVVVLTSSQRQSEDWVAAGAVLRMGRDVDQEIATLRGTARGNYVVFAQRFDGVDLPDDACRILVLDGIPIGDRLCDQVDAERLKNSPGYSVRTVNRIEQALGRAVRSSADYAAILLVGADIAAFVGRRDSKALFEPDTRAQMELGADIAGQLAAAGNPLQGIRDAIGMLLARDADWKREHRERLSAAERIHGFSGIAASMAGVANSERLAWLKAKARNFQNAAEILQRAADSRQLHDSTRAELLARQAAYTNEFDPGRALEIYRAAFQLNSSLPRPIQLQDRRYGRIASQASNAATYLQSFASANGAIARIADIKSRISYGLQPVVVEQAIRDLGEALGATSSRPEQETGRGPDVMWILDDATLCIEAKSDKSSPISKSDAAQLLISLEWCSKNADVDRNSVVAVFATNVATADRREDVSFGPLLACEALLLDLADRLCKVAVQLVYDGPLFSDAQKVGGLLQAAGLSGAGIVRGLARIKS